jgi:signal transduction histidine kinase
MATTERTTRLRRPLEGVRDESRSLVTGALVFRWVWLAWMAALAALGQDELARVWLAWVSIGAATVWTLWLTLTRASWNTAVLVFDVALCVWLILASALVVERNEIILGRPFFATGYPLSAPLLWGAVRGPALGALTAAAMAAAHLLSRPLNGVALSELSPAQVQNVTGAMLNYFVGGVAVGLVARLLQRSTDAVRRANAETVKERELSARLAERESMARTIHDSVLQALALINKRGKELAASGSLDPDDVRQLAETAGKQEVELRALILRAPESAPTGTSSLRDSLEGAARGVDAIRVDVSTTGPLFMDAHTVTELSAAVRQALENVVEHAAAQRVNVFAEDEGGTLTITVRDDGRGFTYDEDRLRADGKVGVLKSMKGRLEDLGGTMEIRSSPGAGTEVEFRVPQHD